MWGQAGLLGQTLVLNFVNISLPSTSKIPSKPTIHHLSGVFEDRCKWVYFDTQSLFDRMVKGKPLSSVSVVDGVD